MDIIIKQLQDIKTGAPVAPRTPERAVYDSTGMRLDESLALMRSGDRMNNESVKLRHLSQEVLNKLSNLQTQIDNIKGVDDTTEKIDNLEEVEGFLAGYSRDMKLKDVISVATEDEVEEAFNEIMYQ